MRTSAVNGLSDPEGLAEFMRNLTQICPPEVHREKA